MGLEPYLLAKISSQNMWEEAEREDIVSCIECGSCAFTCPSHRPLLDNIRLGKSMVMGIIRERAAKK
jgi:electron transport complex protein RnfC